MAEIQQRNGRIYIKPKRDELIGQQERDRQYRKLAFDTFETEIYSKVEGQLLHHFDKYGSQRLDDGNWLKVIVEEEGEAVQAINKLDYDEAYEEIAQVIACWCRLYIELKRMQQGIDIYEQSLGLYSRAV